MPASEPGRFSIPDRVAVFGATLAVCVVYGVAYSYGQFLKPIAQAFGAGQGAGSASFSITVLLGFGLSVVTGPLADRVGARAMLVGGAVCMGLGLWMTAFAGTLSQAYLAYGLGTGVGLACVYVPVLAAIGRRFDTGRALATGIVVTGVGAGTLLGSPLAAWLITQVGWRGAYLWMAGGAGLLLLACAVLIGPAPVRAAAALPVAQRHGRRAFRWLYGSTVLINVVIYVPYVHLSAAAQQMGVSLVSAAGLISAIGLSNVGGRLLASAAAQRVDPMRLFGGCHLGLSLSFLAWILADSYAGLLGFAVVFGASHGAYSALIPVVVAQCFGTARLGKDLGILFTALGIGSAIGSPLAGYLLESTGSYNHALAGLVAIGLGGAFALANMRASHGATVRG